MKKNKKFIKSATIMMFALIVSFLTISPVSAKSMNPLIDVNSTCVATDLNDIEKVEANPKSGGFVSREYVVNQLYKNETYWDYTYLTNAWAYASSYTVTSSTSTTSTSTFSVEIEAKLKENIKSTFGYNYANSVSTAESIGITIPADSTRQSKLRYEVKMQRFYSKVIVRDKYYDTSIGYYYVETPYTGNIDMPIVNETYINVYYK